MMMNTTKNSIVGKCTLRAHSIGIAAESFAFFFGHRPLIRNPLAMARGAARNTVEK